MADQNNNYNPGYVSAGGHIPTGTSPQEAQTRANVEMMTVPTALLHANVENAFSNEGDEISVEKYNTIIGVLLLYGFVVNAILCFIFTDPISSIHPIAMIAIYLIGVIAGMIICRRTENPVVSFIGYNLIVIPMGMFITPILAVYDITTIRYAFCIMGVCMMIMIGLSEMYPQFFRGIGRMLLSCLFVGLLGEVIMWCLGMTSGVFDFIFVGILMGYVGYDWALAQEKRKTTTNAVLSAGLIFSDLIYMLIRLIRILSSRNR